VGRLGDLLEVVHDSHRRYETVRASGMAHGRRWRMWWAGHDRLRTEEDRPDGTSTIVRSGDAWWTREPNGTVHTNDGNPHVVVGFGPGPELTRARSLMSSARLSVLRNEEVAGRPAVLLWVEPRSEDAHRWSTSEPFEAAIDLERGVVLLAPGFNVASIEFDVPLAEEVFSALTAGPGARIVRTSERPRTVDLEEARRAAPFRIRLPRLLPEGARLEECAISPGDPPGWVGLSWTIDPGRRYRLHLRQGPDLDEEAPADAVDRGEIAPASPQGLDMVLVWARGRDDGWGEFESDLPAHLLEAVARSWADADE
jgi:hypothetical protein